MCVCVYIYIYMVVGFFCQITEWTFVGQVTDRLELANI